MARNRVSLILCVLISLFLVFSVTVQASDEKNTENVNDFAKEDGFFGQEALDIIQKTESDENNGEIIVTVGAENENAKKEGKISDFLFGLNSPVSFLSFLAEGKLLTVYSIVLLFASVLICFFGYKLLRYSIGISCFISAGAVTIYIADKINTAESGKITVISVLLAFLIAVIVSAISFCLPKAGTFFFSVICAYVVLTGLKFNFLTAVIISLIVATVSALLVRVFVIALSSGAGGMISGAIICGFIDAPELPYLHIPLGMILAVIGMAVQYSRGKKGRKEKKKE